MQVSIIIPTFNRSSLLSRCLDSLVNQSFPSNNFEIIIVDNNSVDKTYAIANRYIKKYNNVRYFKEERPGLVYVRHTGARNASGDYLIYVDDDGIYNNSCIKEILKVYTEYPEVAAVGGKIDILWDDIPPEWILQYECLLGKLNYGNEVKIASNLFINGGLFSIKKNVLYKVNGFNPDQIGKYLVGDGEVGLCKKLHNKKYLIGWTPYAKMHHLQFINKNATVSDIGRRYYNNGVAFSYDRCKSNNYEFNKSILKYLLRTAFYVAKLLLKYIVFLSFKNSKNYLFSLMYNIGCLVFFIHWMSKRYRKSCKSDNWF